MVAKTYFPIRREILAALRAGRIRGHGCDELVCGARDEPLKLKLRGVGARRWSRHPAQSALPRCPSKRSARTDSGERASVCGQSATESLDIWTRELDIARQSCNPARRRREASFRMAACQQAAAVASRLGHIGRQGCSGRFERAGVAGLHDIVGESGPPSWSWSHQSRCVCHADLREDSGCPALRPRSDWESSREDRAARAWGVHAHSKNQLRYEISRSSLQPIA